MATGKSYYSSNGKTYTVVVFDKRNRVVWTDNSGPGAKAHLDKELKKNLKAFNRIEDIGHMVQDSWADLVEKAPKL